MNPGAVALGPADVGLAALLVLVAGGVSVGLRLGMERRLAVASVRTVVQLLVIGYVLRWVFAADSLPALAPVVLVMLLAASHAAVSRPARTYRGATLRAFATLVFCTLLTTAAVTRLVIGVEPWWKAQYLIPLLGMALGNGLTGISLCLDKILESLSDRRQEVELALTLGATRWEAARPVVADAVRSGMIPILNSMSVVGLVSLPGMMTGQILAGADPVQAVAYQIVIMFMIAVSTTLGCMLVAMLSYRVLFNERHQLRSELVREREE